MKNPSAPINFWRWFDPRSRGINSWAFILNRITALGLTAAEPVLWQQRVRQVPGVEGAEHGGGGGHVQL